MSKICLCMLLALTTGVTQADDVKRTPWGKPDLSGTYDTGTLTPTERPQWLGEVEYLYPWVANLLNKTFALASESFIYSESDPDREAPPEGGDGNNTAGAGGVGGYNAFWVDPGSELGSVDGNVPTSIIYEPANGRYPARQEGVQQRLGVYYQSFLHDNTGTASWLQHDGPGPFDGPESLAPSERCLISFASTVPTLPSLYNNYKRIIQTPTHVMILQEMVHDARIVRIDGEHGDAVNRKWLGDSIGYWDGDVLVVETRHFTPVNGLPGADENLHVIERFSRRANGDLHYDFTVNNDTTWTAPWSGRYTWVSKPTSKLYEYACHEGNYAMGNILRGARLLEEEWRAENSTGSAGGGN
ncbi:MAG: hypothetical protein AAF529_08745 [Pseudomonadota bacterium]